MANFTVKKPHQSGQGLRIAARILFPPILLWDLLKFGTNKLAGQLLSKMVLPASQSDFITTSTFDGGGLTHEHHTIQTHDGAKLDTLEITHDSQKDLKKEHQKYIINFVGNGMSYHQIVDEMQDDARELGVNVIGFDLRGVNRSTAEDESIEFINEGEPKPKKVAQSKDELVTDGIAQVQRLLDEGVSPENITLKAHSLGAGIASLVALHFHEQGIRINLFHGRSFSSITNNVVGWLRTGLETGHLESTGGKVLGWIAKPFIKLALTLANWEINAGDAYRAIPEAYKDYMLVRTAKADRTENVPDDPVIPHYASLHAFLKSDRQAKKAELDRHIEIAEKLGEPVEVLKEEREHFKNRKMHTSWQSNGHVEPMNYLENGRGTSGLNFFRNFVKRADMDHGVTAEKNTKHGVMEETNPMEKNAITK
ncbi:protein SidB [Legionella cardiaca]|uniref:Protein SidB n=1 Tax=Legionella cardiaca TaxID=1071983 RepID=A0ABY8ATA1_9GAMM|nr:protein SidB [Legionella cardiaca]WED42561.1 protein SidB [Legionella cardiaca]